MVEDKKTAIWSGGLDALLASDVPKTAEASVEEKPAIALSTQANDRSGTRIMGSWLSPVVEEAAAKLNAGQQPVTRVLPIEDLYPAVAAAERASTPVPAVPKAQPVDPCVTTEVISVSKVERARQPKKGPPQRMAKLRALATGPERERFFLYGGLGVFLLVMLVAMGVRGIALHFEPQQAPVAQAEAPRPAPVTPSAKVPSLPRSVPVGAGGVVPPGLERAAVDALARGDHAQAQRAYAELAAAQPARSEFHEAVRILSRAGDESGKHRTGN